MISTVCDGDCGLDVLTRMVGRPHIFEARNQLRIEISDYLMDRIDEPWMHNLMRLLQEVSEDDVNTYRRVLHTSTLLRVPQQPQSRTM